MTGIFDSGDSSESDRLQAQLDKQRLDAEKKKKELEDKLKLEEQGRRKGLRGIKSLLTEGETGFENKDKLGD